MGIYYFLYFHRFFRTLIKSYCRRASSGRGKFPQGVLRATLWTIASAWLWLIWNATLEAAKGLNHCGIPEVNIDLTQLKYDEFLSFYIKISKRQIHLQSINNNKTI